MYYVRPWLVHYYLCPKSTSQHLRAQHLLRLLARLRIALHEIQCFLIKDQKHLVR